MRTHAFIVYRSLTRLNAPLSILTLYPVSSIILNEYTLRQRGRRFDRGDRRRGSKLYGSEGTQRRYNLVIRPETQEDACMH